ncbi:hypothetical protein RAS1_41350 [Phycisphaerae bacterium RAS1]|nr:hypothetical protein RAS1_41350 [Phycisphaerae bacterium RAS1]
MGAGCGTDGAAGLRRIVARISAEQFQRLSQEVDSHDFLHRVWREIEKLQRLVFHSNERADWSLVRASSKQILMAEIVSRHGGQIDGVYFALRTLESGGKPWPLAIRELAGSIHSYFTTPLGIVMRRDLFGDDTVFLSPDAEEMIRRHAGEATRDAAS